MFSLRKSQLVKLLKLRSRIYAIAYDMKILKKSFFLVATLSLNVLLKFELVITSVSATVQNRGKRILSLSIYPYISRQHCPLCAIRRRKHATAG